jgi:hypothetical protein
MSLKSRIKNIETLKEPDEKLEALKECLRQHEPNTVPDDVVDIASALAALAGRLPE